MKKRTSNLSRRIVSLLMSMVLTLTLVTPAAFATEVVDGSGTTIVEGDTNPADVNTSGDTEGKNDVDKNTEDGKDEQQPADPDDEDKEPGEDDEKNADAEDADDGDIYDVQEDTLLGVSLYAAAETWDGKTTDITWYDDSKNEFEISTAAQLAGLAQLVSGKKTFSEKTIKLMADINLGGHPWTPIGGTVPKKNFSGTFNGNGFIVSGLDVGAASGVNGLFKVVKGAVIKNLIVEGNIKLTGKASGGGIVGKLTSNSTVQNCGFYGVITAEAAAKVGGIVGDGAATNCWYYYTGDDLAYDYGVCGGAATSCYTNTNTKQTGVTIVTADQFKGAAAVGETGKTVVELLNISLPDDCMDWFQGADYPAFASGSIEQKGKTVRLRPFFPDCGFTVSIEGEGVAYDMEKNIYTVGEDTLAVKLVRSDGKSELWVTTKPDGTEAHTIDLSKDYDIHDTKTTLYYGTEEDFATDITWWYNYQTQTRYAINSVERLRSLTRLVNSGKVANGFVNVLFELKGVPNNILDLSGVDYEPIGTSDHPFRGSFAGQYYGGTIIGTVTTIITGLTISGDYANVGLFGVVDSGTIQYVTIADTTTTKEIEKEDGTKETVEVTVPAGTVTGSGNVGSIVGWLQSGTVENCMSTVVVNGSSNAAVVGGLVGLNEGTVSSSYYYNDEHIGTLVVGKTDSENAGVKQCFYLAEDGESAFGEEGDIGAREKIEFEVGRVTYELNGPNRYLWLFDTVTKRPTLKNTSHAINISQLTLTAEELPEGVTVEIKLGDENTIVLTKGNIQYIYGRPYSSVPVTVESVTVGYQVVFNPKPQNGKLRIGTDYTYKLTAADISWYVGHENDVEYTLTTASQLEGFAILVNGTAEGDISFKDKTIKLGNDIELTGTWTPIGIASGGHFFEGTFDGQKHTIKDLRVNTDDAYAGLFGYVRHGTVKNLTVEGSVRSISGTNTAGIVGYLYQGTVENCTNKAEVTAVMGSVGGVVGHAYEGNGECHIEKCKNNAAVTATGNEVNGAATGGIVGSTGDKVIVRLCENTGDVTASGTKDVSASGIGGWRVLNSHNSGRVEIASGTADYLYAGGISAEGFVDSCQNDGEVYINAMWNGSQGFNYAGGITGGGTVTNSYNTAAVVNNFTYADSAVKLQNGVAAGIAANPTSSIFNCYNIGDVSSTEGETHGLGGVGVPGVCDSGAENSYYVCKLNGEELMKYVSTAGAESDVAYNETDKTYMVGDKLLVDMLNENGSGGTPWFVNAEKNIILPTFMVLWNGDRHADSVGIKLVYVIYEPGDGICRTVTGQPRKDAIVLKPDENGTIQPVSYTVLNAEAAGVGNENGTFQMWSDGSSTYAAGGAIILSGDEGSITLTAQWETIWSGTGTETDPYQISNLADLTALQTQVNGKSFDYGDKWFRLMADIDMKDAGNWTPIGDTYETHFAGSFDGAGKTITNLYVSTDGEVAGLFGWATANQSRTFKDLTLKGTVEHLGSSGGWCGSLIAVAYNGSGRGVTLRDITVDVTVRSHRAYATAGIVGRGVAEAKNCVIYGLVEGGAGLTCGDGGLMENCHNHAEIRGSSSAVGLWSGSVKAVDCSNDGAVTATSESYTGSAAGITSGGTVIRCANSGEIKGNGPMRVNGITISGSAEYCTNTGTVRSEKGSAYGISVSGSAEYCKNTGNIHGAVSASGIIGEMSASFCYNLGAVTANNSKQAYGIGGRYVENCFTYNPNSHVALAPVLWRNKEVTAKNSYYLANSATELNSAGEYATLADFASGKVAWGVGGKGEGSQGGTGQDAKLGWWKQDKDDKYPTLLDNSDMSKRYYRAQAGVKGVGGTVSIKSSRNFTGDADNAVYGPKGMSVTVTATPKDDTFGLKSLTLDLMGTGSTTALESGDSFTLGEANALVVATFASTGNGGNGDGTGGSGGDGDGTGTDTGDGAGDEDDEGLQDGLNLEVEYDVKGLILSAYGAWGAEGSGKTFAQWLKDSPEVLRALITNSLDNMAVAAMGKKTDEAKDLAALLLASLNEHSGLDGQSSDTIAKMLRRYIESGTEAAFSAWLTTGGGMASGTYESIYAQYTNSLLALADRLYTNWESSGTSLTFPVWLDAQQVTMESLSENAEEPDTEPDDTQTTEAPEDVPDGQEAEGGASGGGNSVWEVIGTVVRENPIIVWSIVAVIAALIIVGAVRRYHKVKRDERDDVTSKK